MTNEMRAFVLPTKEDTERDMRPLPFRSGVHGANACRAKRCIRIRMKALFAGLAASFLGLGLGWGCIALPASAVTAEKLESISPAANTWSRISNSPWSGHSATPTEAVLLADGEVAIHWPSLGPSRARVTGFFSGRSLRLLQTDHQSGDRIYQGTDGSRVRSIGWERGKIELPDGSSVSVDRTAYRDCWRGPENAALVVRAPNGSVKIRKFLFTFLRKPEVFSSGTSGQCPEGRFPKLVSRIAPVHGPLLLLPDGTFLLVDERGLVLRLDADLSSGSSLMGSQIFSFEGREGKSFLTSISGTDYFPESGARYQEALDDLFVEMRRRKKK